ncbi:MAG: DUF1846 family protein [Oscillospiraceae bacterium]|nr:DUF1846 family protein [Oscillospiraceae bacterium]
MQQLEKLAGCEAHSTVLLSYIGENVFRKLKVNITYEPRFQNKSCFINKAFEITTPTEYAIRHFLWVLCILLQFNVVECMSAGQAFVAIRGLLTAALWASNPSGRQLSSLCFRLCFRWFCFRSFIVFL